MKIIYRQPPTAFALESAGIKNCYYKYLVCAKDAKNTSRREHYHTTFEIHMIEKGSQTYQIGDMSHTIHEGEFLLIPPGVRHCFSGFFPCTSKIGVTFDAAPGSPFSSINNIFHLPMGGQISDNIACILGESRIRRHFSAQLIEGRIFETLILILRRCGYKETASPAENESEDARILLARRFIHDNIELNLKVSDVAAYCHLSTKQLLRIFQLASAMSPAAYIQKQRIKHIETLLSQTNLSLKFISEKMHFSNEYHFNSFFKKHAGMPPGEYRKMNRQQSGA